MFFIDTETCGFHGLAVLIQYAEDGGPTILHEVMYEPAEKTLKLIERFADGYCVIFNAAYDWFHLYKLWTVLGFLPDKTRCPIDCVPDLVDAELKGRDHPECLKPKGICDLMLHARKTKYQSTMDRKDIRIRRVPRQLSFYVAQELEKRIKLNDIYFARSKKLKERWKIHDITNSITGKTDPDFVDIVLKFNPSSALKAIVVDAGLRKDRLLFSDIDGGLKKPYEETAIPIAKLISKGPYWFVRDKGITWPGLIRQHAEHWRHHESAREYAADDVVDLQMLYEYLDKPEFNDSDSQLACMVGAIRWRGYAVDIDEIEKLAKVSRKKAKQAPLGQKQAYAYITKHMNEDEIKSLVDRNGSPSTAKVVLESISTWTTPCKCCVEEQVTVEEFCPILETTIYKKETQRTPNKTCTLCAGSGERPHPAGVAAEEVLTARKENTKKATFDKLIKAGRLHPSATVIGSLSGRMSGRTEVGDGQRASGINALGIQGGKEIRKAFKFAFGGLELSGGDFDAYEISIAVAAWNDQNLLEQLLSCNECDHLYTPDEFRTSNSCPSCKCSYTACKNCKGQIVVKGTEVVKPCSCGTCDPWPGGEGTFRKIHALFAMELYPGNSYNDIVASKGTAKDMYDDGKRSLFGGIMYGGDENTIHNRVGIDLEVATQARQGFFQRFKGVQEAQNRCYESFCSMRQPRPHGPVEWHEPKECVTSLTGFSRYFTLEHQITKALFDLAEKPPKTWLALKVKVRRRDRDQFVGGAVRSALFAAAFQIQAQCMRAALNHEIQSTGAELTKELQVDIWDLQPTGVSLWRVQPMNVHDELMCPNRCKDEVEKVVEDFVERRKELIPLLKMSWSRDLADWSGK